MAKITIEELSDSLKEYLKGSGLNEAQVQELIDKFEDEKIGDISQLSTEEKESLVGAINEVNQKANKEVDLSNYQQKTDNSLQTSSKNLVGAINEINQKANKEVDLSNYQQKTDNSLQTSSKNLVGAINELFQNANNGKELIASAIGEPLSSSDTFSAMSNDINWLLSQFKTNMMKNGITIESGDKFKSLIDKIATLSDSEGKGIKYKTGKLNDLNFEAGTSTSETRTLDVNFEFTPNIVFIEGKTIGNMYGEDNIPVLLGKGVDVIINNQLQAFLTITSYNSTSITFKFSRYTNESGTGVRNLIYHAIGVGEEDTTLRDSLASILQGEGVNVSDEDDMASLINKVDSEFDRKNANSGLDIISATELPATGKENQICVITDNPVDSFIMTGDSAEYDNNKVVIYNSTGNSNYNAVKNNITYSYNISRVQYQSDDLSSYYWGNNQWNQLTFGSTILFKNGEFLSTDLTGGFGTGGGVSISGSEFAFVGDRNVSLISTTTKKINFSNFKTLKVTLYTNNSNTFIVGSFMNTYSGNQSSTFTTTGKTYNIYRLTPLTTETEMSIDISDWTTGYLGFFRAAHSVAPSIYITKITLE